MVKYVVTCMYNDFETGLPEYLREYDSPLEFALIMANLEKAAKSPFVQFEGENLPFTRNITLNEIRVCGDEEYYIETRTQGSMTFELICFRKRIQPKIESKSSIFGIYEKDSEDDGYCFSVFSNNEKQEKFKLNNWKNK